MAPELVSRIFDQAMEIAPGERAPFLERSCQNNPELLATVERLLALAEGVDTDPLWSRSALEHEARAVGIPEYSKFDRYQIEERIGAGGMGTVYKAVRTGDRFSKLVAIKIVHDPDEAAVQRFIQERRILAALDHPNIAKLLDGGSTPEGCPFLAMEYVEGVPIDRYVKEQRLGPRQILSLFRQVCSAVSYAHRNLVVHRDLKPANILVTADGFPKLLDFGIAKVTDGSGRKTRTGLAAMTLEYSSPEQIRGDIAGTASDIYSLGILLYELLAGRSPYGSVGGTIDLARRICEEEPLPLTSRGDSPLDPDIGNIVAMAIRKEPPRRYASADQFDEDIRRYLEGYPIIARPDTRRYRLTKFIGRNRLYVGAAAALALAIVAGIGATVWQARIARQEAALATARFNDLRELSNSYLFEFHDAIANLPGSTAARALVVRRALQYLGKLSKDASASPELQRELAAAYERLADEQGERGQSLGDRPAAIASLRQAAAIRRAILEKSPPNKQDVLELARDITKMAPMTQLQGDLAHAHALGAEAVALMQRVTRQDDPPPFQIALSEAYTVLGDAAGGLDVPGLGHLDQAIGFYKKAAATREQLIARHPENRDESIMLRALYGRIAGTYYAQGRFDEAVDRYRGIVDFDEQELKKGPPDIHRAYYGMPWDDIVRREIAIYARTISLIATRQGRMAQARQYGDRSYQIFAELAKADPANLEAREALADSTYSQAYILEHEHREQAALAMYRTSVALYADIIRQRPSRIPPGLRTDYEYLADLYLQMKNPREASATAAKNLALCDKLLAIDAGNTSAQRLKAIALLQTGRADAMEGRDREARELYMKSLQIWDSQRAQGTLLPRFLPRVEETRNALAELPH